MSFDHLNCMQSGHSLPGQTRREHVKSGHASTSRASLPMSRNHFSQDEGSGRRNGEAAIEGIYELVSRRERPPGIHDEAFDTFALTVETAAARLRAKWQEADYPGGLKEQEGVMFCAAVEALGLLRANSSRAYSTIIVDLFRRDPTNDEFRSKYTDEVAEQISEVVSNASFQSFEAALHQAANRKLKWMFFGFWLGILFGAVGALTGEYFGRMSALKSHYGPSSALGTPLMSPSEIEIWLQKRDLPLSAL